MATVKISALTAITGAAVDQANDVIPIVDATGPETKKITVAQLLGLVSTAITVGTTTTTGTTGSVLFCDTGVVQEDNTNFYWDNTNNRLGLGATAPAARLDIRAAGALNTDIGLRVRNSANDRNIIEVLGDEVTNINSGQYALYKFTKDGNSAPDMHLYAAGVKTLSLGTIYNDFGDFNYSGGLYLYNWGSLKTLIKSGGTSYISESKLAIGATTATANLEVRAPGALSTSYAFRVRNSADTVDLVDVTGDGAVVFKSNANEVGFTQDSAGYTAIGAYANNSYGLAVQRKGSGGVAYFGFSGTGTVMTVANAGTGGGTGINCAITNTSGFCVGAYFTATGASLANWGLVVNASNASDHNYALKIQGGDISLEATGGHKIGVATTQKISLWNQTPIVQPASANQAALTNSTGGTYDGTLAAVAGTGDDATINNNFTDIYTLLNAMRTAMVDFGSMKGSA